jgi:mRNA degradation ribonuclease J1/J2
MNTCNSNTLKIIPLGGLGEIGLNMMVFEFQETIFIVDAGLMFPEHYMLGIDKTSIYNKDSFLKFEYHHI